MRRALGLVVAALLVGGCSVIEDGLIPRGAAVPYPAGCARYDLSPVRCTAIVGALAQRSGIQPDQASEIWLLGDAACETDGGQQVLCTRTMSFAARVRFVLADGRTLEETQFCGPGGQYSILCSDDPEIALSLPTDGYGDIPCMGEAPDTCATPLPPPDPEWLARARPLTIDELAIPIDHIGDYVVPLGEGSLANGLLEASSMELPAKPAGTLLSERGIQLRIESLEADGRPFDNRYLHGRRQGLERFRAWLELEVLSLAPGATINLEAISIR
ncbi:MAG TPA: hypothetical protein VM451_05135 [Candidatus Limnocylindria bacterium]|nr:hypothetical protein [Candidatus Limnocylindria bacterium]